MMKLLVSHTSPYARKCRVLVRELGLLDQVEEIEAHPFENGELLLNANPLGRVPCLIGEDGNSITESLFIAEVLNGTADAPWSNTLDNRRMDILATGLIDLAVARRVEMVRDEASWSDYWIGRREDGIRRTLDVLENQSGSFRGEKSLEGLTLAVALDYLDFRFPESQWRDGRPGLRSIHQNWSTRPSFGETAPPADA